MKKNAVLYSKSINNKIFNKFVIDVKKNTIYFDDSSYFFPLTACFHKNNYFYLSKEIKALKFVL